MTKPTFTIKTLKWQKRPYGVYAGLSTPGGRAVAYVCKRMIPPAGYTHGGNSYPTLMEAITAAQECYERGAMIYLDPVQPEGTTK